MTKAPESLRIAGLSAVLAIALIVSPSAFAAETCAEALKNAKLEMGDEGSSRPHMEPAEKHMAAAEAAKQSGDEAKCLEEVEQAMKWIRMNRQHHGG